MRVAVFGLRVGKGNQTGEWGNLLPGLISSGLVLEDELGCGTERA